MKARPCPHCGVTGISIGMLTPKYRPSHGLCPACDAVMDDSGCRITSLTLISPNPGPPPELSEDDQALRERLLTAPYCADVWCTDPVLMASHIAWNAGQHERAHELFSEYARHITGAKDLRR